MKNEELTIENDRAVFWYIDSNTIASKRIWIVVEYPTGRIISFLIGNKPNVKELVDNARLNSKRQPNLIITDCSIDTSEVEEVKRVKCISAFAVGYVERAMKEMTSALKKHNTDQFASILTQIIKQS